MKITFIGTSHGVPAADRYCSCTMIEAGNSVYFIDGGAPMIDELLRHGRHPDEVRAVFNTHVHGDHTAGIYHFADLIDWYYKKASVDMYIADQPYIDALKNLIKAGNPHTSLSPDRLRFHLNDPNVAYEDENIKVGIATMPEEFLETYRKQGGTGHYTKGMKMLCFYDSEGKAKIPFSRILVRNKCPEIREGVNK